MKSSTPELEELRKRIIRKEQELSIDTSMPQEAYHQTSRAFRWVCEQIDEVRKRKE